MHRSSIRFPSRQIPFSTHLTQAKPHASSYFVIQGTVPSLPFTPLRPLACLLAGGVFASTMSNVHMDGTTAFVNNSADENGGEERHHAATGVVGYAISHKTEQICRLKSYRLILASV